MTPAGKKVSFECWMGSVCESVMNAKVMSPFGDLLPAFPSEEMQRNTTSLSGESALQSANGFYVDVSTALELSHVPIQPTWKILDFGSCWGRISRFFMRDVPKRNIYGLDVEGGFVDICNQLFDSDTFTVCNALPPCKFSGSSIDLISAYSVFSHLSEAAFNAWMREFSRILKPGGIVAFTTRNDGFLDYCQELGKRMQELSGYPRALATMLGSDPRLKSRYLSGNFVFASSKGVSGGGSMNDSFYGEAFIPRAYVEERLRDDFEVLDFKRIGQAYDQALFVLKKRA